MRVALKKSLVRKLKNIFPFPVFFSTRAIPGSTTWSTPGTYSFVVPFYNTMTVTVNGAGGSGGADIDNNTLYTSYTTSPDGSTGGNSSFASATSCVGNGGAGGAASTRFDTGKGYITSSGTNGAAGGASGPSGGTATTGGGAAGGAGGTWETGTVGGTGGSGGKFVKTFTAGASDAPVPGSTITVAVGAHGNTGANNGTNGSVSASWN